MASDRTQRFLVAYRKVNADARQYMRLVDRLLDPGDTTDKTEMRRRVDRLRGRLVAGFAQVDKVKKAAGEPPDPEEPE